MNLTLSLINNTTNPNLHTSKPVFAVSFSANNKVNDNFKKSNINTSSPKNKSYIHLPAILKADKLGADEKTKAEIKEAKLRILEQISSQLEQKQTYISVFQQIREQHLQYHLL